MPAAAVSAKENNTPEFRPPVGTIMLFLVAALVARSLIDLKMVAAGLAADTAKHLSALAGFVALLILMLPIFVKTWPSVHQQLQWPPSWSKLLLGSVVLGFVLWLGQMLAMIAIAPLRSPNPLISTMQTWPTYAFACKNPGTLLLAIPVMVVVTPIIEEIVHRGIIFRALLPSGKMTAAISSAFFFAILHKPTAIPFAFPAGIFLALQLIRRKTLWAPIITHAVTNLLVTISATCFAGQWNSGTFSLTVVSPATLFAAGSLACLFIAWYLTTETVAGAESSISTPA